MQNQQLRQVEDFFSGLYENARHYTNAVIGTGYAAFFATWGFTRDYLSAEVELLSILLVLLSLASFVGWEVWSNVKNALALRKVGKTLTEAPAGEAGERLVRYGQDRQRRDVEALKWWGISASVSIIAAVLALLLLGGSILVRLISTLGPKIL